MNQNVYGMFLFCAIVGVAIFASVYYVALPEPQPIYEKPVYVAKPEGVSKYKCNLYKREKPEVEIVQSVLNVKTKKLDTQFSLSRISSNVIKSDILFDLHFFHKSDKGYEYLGKERISAPMKLDLETNTIQLSSSQKWSNTLRSFNNLYVMPDFNIDRTGEVEFDESKATSILLDFGKN